MVMSLMVSTALIVMMSATVETIRRSNVDLLSSSIGRYDIAVSKTDISPDPFIEVERTSQIVATADERITDVYPRIVSTVDLRANGEETEATLVARVPDEEIGLIDVISGTLDLENGGVALFEDTAANFGVEVGDVINVAYSFPQPRAVGEPTAVGASERQAVGSFPVTAIVRQSGVIATFVRDGLMMDFAYVQDWLGLDNRATTLITLVEPAIYEAGNSEDAALEVREIGIAVQQNLGEDYNYSLDKANILDQSSAAFLVLQALINTYGLMAFGVVGLLIHTLVMTNVQEQRREMAILRILGSLRNYLFTIVMSEVAVIGLFGVGFGVLLGRLLNQYAMVPWIESLLAQDGITVTIQPQVSFSVVLPAVIAAFVVLFVSAIKPARDASRTKVMYAINPGVADNIQLEDLAELREQRPNTRFFIWGLVLLVAVGLALGLDVVSSLGNPAWEATLFLSAILWMVLGLGFVFLILTRPLERLVLFIISFIAPRMTYFAERNVSRSNKRNTLISLLVLFSGVLPSFLATQNAISVANIETDVVLSLGAPVEINVFTRFSEPGLESLDWLKPSFIDTELAAFEDVEDAVGITSGYRADISDAVGMRTNSLELLGVTADLGEILFEDMMIFSGGDASALEQIVTDDDAIIISEGLAEVLAVSLGGTLKLKGAGLDHEKEFVVIGIVRRLPGFGGFGRARSTAQSGGSQALISMNAYYDMITDPKEALPEYDSQILTRILAGVRVGTDAVQLDQDLSNEFGFSRRIRVDTVDAELEDARNQQRQSQVFLLVLTLISFTTAVFGVFAVIYVTIYSRRAEIGMMKAVGTRRWELTGMLIIESIAMTLSAALAGIVAGATMGYLFAYLENIGSERPMIFAVDSTVMPFVIIMVVLASIIGAVFSARRIIRYKAIEILRMS